MLQIKNTLGGGKPEGLYAWKKCSISYSEGGAVTHIDTTFYSKGSLGVAIDVYYASSYTFNEDNAVFELTNPTVKSVEHDTSDAKYFSLTGNQYFIIGSPTGKTMYKSGASGGATRIINGTSCYVTCYNTSYPYSVIEIEENHTFIDYVVSDKETAYPDGGEKGGYWYERVSEGITPGMFGCTKMAVDTLILTADTKLSTYTVNHSLGKIPKVILVIAETAPTVAWRLNRCLCDNSGQGTSANCVMSYYNSGLVNNTYLVNSITNSSFILYATVLFFRENVTYNIITMV